MRKNKFNLKILNYIVRYTVLHLNYVLFSGIQYFPIILFAFKFMIFIRLTCETAVTQLLAIPSNKFDEKQNCLLAKCFVFKRARARPTFIIHLCKRIYYIIIRVVLAKKSFCGDGSE